MSTNFVHSCVNPVELDPTGWKETEQGHAGPNEAKCGRRTEPNGAKLGRSGLNVAEEQSQMGPNGAIFFLSVTYSMLAYFMIL